ncbi:DUF3300 domain-containing protein [Oxalobacteraceae bacterium A2-2]
MNMHKTTMAALVSASLLALAGCNQPANTPQAAGAAPAAAAYQPPTAEQLQQMVAPIALYPDKLVAQVLAGSTYPDQVSAANLWLAQHPSLSGNALQAEESQQPWDVSIKSLTTFPNVLGQMAANLPWTTALGQAYANDPADVMNAIQVMRARAQQNGSLKNSAQLRVSTTVRSAQAAEYAATPVVTPGQEIYDAPPAVIPPPPQTIVIESAQPDVVYVPHYNPSVVYGPWEPVYPGWVDRAPPPPPSPSGNPASTGALTFGVGILVGAALSHAHDGGWHAWNMDWGGPAPRPGHDEHWRRPAVVYNNATYVTKSVSVVNNNIVNNSYRTVNNFNGPVNRSQNVAVTQLNQVQMPHAGPREAAPPQPPRSPVAMPAPARLAQGPHPAVPSPGAQHAQAPQALPPIPQAIQPSMRRDGRQEPGRLAQQAAPGQDKQGPSFRQPQVEVRPAVRPAPQMAAGMPNPPTMHGQAASGEPPRASAAFAKPAPQVHAQPNPPEPPRALATMPAASAPQAHAQPEPPVPQHDLAAMRMAAASQAHAQPGPTQPQHAAPAASKAPPPQMHAQFKPAEAPRPPASAHPAPAPHEMHASAAPHPQQVPPQAKHQEGGRDHDKHDPREHHG